MPTVSGERKGFLSMNTIEQDYMGLKDAVGHTIIGWLKEQEASGVDGNDALDSLIKVMLGYGAFYAGLAVTREDFLSLADVAYDVFSSEGETLQ